MSQSGRTCRKRDRRTRTAADDIELDVHADRIAVRVRGEIVRTLSGRDAADVRAALDHPDQLARLLARKMS